MNNKLDKYFQDERERLNNLDSPAYFEDKMKRIAEQHQRGEFEKAGFVARLGGFLREHKKVTAACATAFTAIIIAGAAFMFAPNSNDPSQDATPFDIFTGTLFVEALAAETDNIVQTDTAFLIKASEPIEKEAIEKSINVAPYFEYELTANSENTEFTLTPTEELDGQTVYSISVDPAMTAVGAAPRMENSWVFQTVSDFVVDTVYPADKSSYVVANSGIEIAFSEAPDLNSVKEKVTFSPAIEGSWQVNSNTAIFVPSAALQYGTIYTIDIAAGIKNENGERELAKAVVSKFETEPNEDMYSATDIFYIAGDNKCFAPEVIPFFEVYKYRYDNQLTELDAKIYQFPDVDSYMEALISRTQTEGWASYSYYKTATISTDGLTEVASLKAPVNTLFYGHHAQLEEALPIGMYLLELSNGAVTRQALFQVTDLAGYLTYSPEQALIWLNDLEEDLAVVGAVITDNTGKIATKTNEEGIAIIEIDPENPTTVLKAALADRALLFNLPSSYYSPNKQFDYWSYLYTDRTLYRPGEELNYFGILTPRYNDTEPLEDVKLVINGRTSSQEIEVNDGIFEGKMTLPDLEPGYYGLSLQSGDYTITSTSFEVAFYEKPAYKLELEVDKDAAKIGEDITFTVTTSYFDGTPLPRQNVTIHGSLFENKTLTTDENGKASLTVKVVNKYLPHSLVAYQYASATAAFPEIGHVWTDVSYSCINNNIQFLGQAKRADDTAVLDLTIKGVDMNTVEDWNIIKEEEYVDFNGTQEVQLTFTRFEPVREEDGTYYNPYTKQTETRYYYYTKNVTEFTTTAVSNGDKLTYEYPLQTGYGYQIFMKGTDSEGNPFERTYFVSSKEAIDYGDLNRGTIHINTVEDDATYLVGETVNMLITANGIPLKVPEGGKLLYIQTQNEITDYEINNTCNYSFEFTNEHIYNTQVKAAYFDGTGYKVAWPHTVYFDTSKNLTQLDFKADKEKYNPGDTVNIDVQLKDVNGKPLQGYVNINLVDEALLAIRDQYVNFATSIFGSQYHYRYFEDMITHESFSDSAIAEGGGEGDGGRTEFRDVAVFATVKTDANGKGKITFQLPDNITTWRVIWHGYAKDGEEIYAANGSESIVATQPFFIDWRFAGPFLTGDQPMLSLRSAGNDLNSEKPENIEYTVNIAEMNYSKTFTGTAFNWADLQLPALKKGSYTMTMSGKCGELTDKATITFDVVDTMVQHIARTTTALTDAYKPAIYDKQMVNLVFANSKATLAFNGLIDLAGQASIRVEQLIAANLAGKMLEQFDKDYYGSKIDDQQFKEQLMRYQGSDGGIKPLTAAESDVEVSALVASTAKDYVDTFILTRYFKHILTSKDTDRLDKATALWGLAALGEPVLGDINKMLAETNLSGEEKLSLVMALYFAGDGAKSKPLAQQLIAENTSVLEEVITANVSDDPQINKKATARLALLASAYDLPETEKLYTYVRQNHNPYDYFLLEQCLILKNLINKVDLDAGFTYTLDGETTRVDNVWYYSLLLDKEQAANITFSDIVGDVQVTQTYYADGLPETNAEFAKYLTVTRKYNDNTGNEMVLPQNNRIRVTVSYTIDANAPAGYYSFVDYLPAGLRFVNMEYTQENKHVYLQQEKGQKLTFNMYKGEEAVSGTFSYITRTTMPGSYTAEPLYMLNTNNTVVNTATDAVKMTIE